MRVTVAVAMLGVILVGCAAAAAPSIPIPMVVNDRGGDSHPDGRSLIRPAGDSDTARHTGSDACGPAAAPECGHDHEEGLLHRSQRK